MNSLIKIDFKNSRLTRQKLNNLKVYESIKDNNKDEFNKNINKREFYRLIDDLEINFDELWEKSLKDDLFAKVISRTLSFKATRQSTTDEKEQLRVCNHTAIKHGVKVEQITKKQLRPTKDGRIINNRTMKKENILRENCLKTFDGEISGKLKGYITAKVVFGNGGHQDNVFEELITMGNWWKKYKNESSELLVILVDTDLINKYSNLEKLFENIENIKILNHYSFQEFVCSEVSGCKLKTQE